MDAAAILDLFDVVDKELWVITARAGHREGGLIATFVSRASLVPQLPRVLIGLAKHHYTWELIESSGAFGLHLLGEEHLPWVWRFGLQSGREFNKLEGIKTHEGASGTPLLSEALGWLDCRVELRVDTGDRTIFLAEILQGRLQGAAPPLTRKRLMQLAPADKLGELQKQFADDCLLDAEAIRMWRKQRQTHSDAIAERRENSGVSVH